MPHSSGGGSHGGGSHGGSHGGSSGPRISTHYFTGAHRYRKHHVTTGEDEYVYASSMPRKTGLGSIIFLAVFGLFFVVFGLAGIISDRPSKLKTDYWDSAAIHDDIELFKHKGSLLATLEEFQDITGICPVIYTAFDEDWQDQYTDLESYAYDVYVSNFSDESHFVIVYSISSDDLVLLQHESIGVPDYAWEAIQGDDTDKILTETTFQHFADKVQKELENGENPGRAFKDGFEFLNQRYENQLKPGSFSRVGSFFISCIPLLFVISLVVFFLSFSISKYKKDKDVEYEEIPLDLDPKEYENVPSGNYHSKEFHYDASQGGPVPKAAKVITYAITVPFTVVGFIMIAAGIGMMRSTDATGGGFVLIFGVIWTIISFFTLVKMTAAFVKAKKQTGAAPLTAEYPKAEYPDMNKVNGAPQNTVTSAPDQTEFDPQFFNNSKSNIEDDDEDYKRMKRKGFE